MFSNIQLLTEHYQNSELVVGTHDLALLSISLLIAIFTALVALKMARRIRRSPYHLEKNVLWLISSITIAGGVWAMHFMGLLAFELCGLTGYHTGLTIASLLPAFLASALATRTLVSKKVSLQKALLSGILIGTGILMTHFMGMSSLQTSSTLYYQPHSLIFSVLYTILMAPMVVWLSLSIKKWYPGLTRWSLLLVRAGLIGVAVFSIHYLDITAALFVVVPDQCESLELAQMSPMLQTIITVGFFIGLLVLGLHIYLKQRTLRSHLKRERNRLYAIINTAVDGIILISSRGQILEYNPACEDMFGYDREEVLGKNIRMLMPEPYQSEHDQYLSNYLSTGKQKFIGVERELEGLRKDNTTFPLELSVGEAIDDDGRMFIGLLRDITARKKMEADLQEAVTKAERSAETKTTFLTNMSHEIRTPMNAIMGFVDVVLSKPLEDEQRGHLLTVQKSAKSLLRLLNDILDTAKMDEHSFELEHEPFDLIGLLKEIESLFFINARSKGLEWRVEYPGKLPQCYLGDITRVRQILTNLVGNALKFTLEGGVYLKVDWQDSVLKFRIIDTGIGIPADKLDNIFNPFFQTDASMTRRFGGTGLGTSIARQLVELMGGVIKVTSEVDKGSEFSFELKLEPVECPKVEASSDSRNSITPKRLLIVEDVQANAELLTLNLNADGHETIWVENGKLAVEKRQTENFDAILMDVQMPVMDGLTASKSIRAWEREYKRKPVPIIALTAGAFKEDEVAAREAGMNGFTTKPIDMNALYQTLSLVLNEHMSRTDTDVEDSFFSNLALKSIDQHKGLLRWGNEQKYYQNLMRFAEDYITAYIELVKLLEAGKIEEALRLLHSLRGVAGNLEMPKLQRAVVALETCLKEKQPYEEQLAHFFTSHSSVINELTTLHSLMESRQMSQECDDETEQELLDCEQLKAHIVKMTEMLSRGQYDQSQIDSLDQFVGKQAKQPDYQGYQKALDSFEFEQAINCLEQFLANICEGDVDG